MTEPKRRGLPNPPLRLAQATMRLAFVASFCTLLAWSLPLRAGGLTSRESAPTSVLVSSAVLGLLAALLYRSMRSTVPNPLRVAVLLATAGVGSFAALHSFAALDPADHRYQSGPAGWVCAALFAGTAALALFAGAAMYEDWRDRHSKAPEHAVARQRLEAVLSRRDH